MERPASESFPLRRRDLAARLLADSDDLLVVAGLGSTAWDVTAAGDRPLNFPLWGAMGGASMIGLGLALAQPERRVLVITGDGELLMNLGSLATIAVQRPANLALVVFDNERYGETGMQPTHTAHGVDLAAIAAACGFPITGTLREEHEVDAALPAMRTSPGPVLHVAKVRAEPLPFVLPPKDGAYLKDRFRHALLGELGECPYGSSAVRLNRRIQRRVRSPR